MQNCELYRCILCDGYMRMAEEMLSLCIEENRHAELREWLRALWRRVGFLATRP